MYMWWGRYFVSEVLVPPWLLLYKAIILYTYILYVRARTQEQMYNILLQAKFVCAHRQQTSMRRRVTAYLHTHTF